MRWQAKIQRSWATLRGTASSPAEADIPPIYYRFTRFLLPSTLREGEVGRRQIAKAVRLSDGKTVRKGRGESLVRPHAYMRPPSGEPHERFTPGATNRCARMAYTEVSL